MTIQNVLAIDTAMFACSAACYDAVNDRGQSEVLAMPRGQAEHLVPMIERVLDKQGCSYKDIDLVAVTRGPGAFTGVRIGLATAQGLALSLGVPIVGVVTTEVIAEQYFATQMSSQDKGVLVITETKRKDYYVQGFDKVGGSIADPASLELSEIVTQYELSEFLVIGDAAKRFAEHAEVLHPDVKFDIVTQVFDLPDPVFVAKLAHREYESGIQSGSIDDLHPLYLRQADVSKPKHSQRKLVQT